ncbi:MAG: archaetidylserine decarboxylase [Planctomycetota bacterium]|nr:archaetidylserine decarboxylase [Planctomycetota bacterium]
MGALRHISLSALPKFLLSRTTGLLTRTRLPHALRPRLYRWFARRYGVDLDEVDGELEDFESLAKFFCRSLKRGVRPIAEGEPLVSPCDGRIITAGPIQNDRIEQVKGRRYSVKQLLQDTELATRLSDGYQATIYLAPGDYHRVHSPLAGQLVRVTHIPGALFPVNPAAVDSIPDLFPRNERVVFHLRLANSAPAAVVMVSALNVSDTRVTAAVGTQLELGDELGQFGFGSTTIVITPHSGPAIMEMPREQRVWMGAALQSEESAS